MLELEKTSEGWNIVRRAMMGCESCNGCFYPSDRGVVAVDGQIPSDGRRIFRDGRGVVPDPKIVLSLED